MGSFKRAASICTGAVVAALLAPGCQVVLGIEEWEGAVGGAGSSTPTSAEASRASSVDATSTAEASSSSADASSSSSGGTTCTGVENTPTCCGPDKLDCLGGACSASGVCGKLLLSLATPVADGLVDVLGDDLVFAVTPVGGMAEFGQILSMDKVVHGIVTEVAETSAVTALTTAVGKVHYATSGALYSMTLGQDPVLVSAPDSTTKSTIVTDRLDYVTLGAAEQLCFTNGTATNGGIYCQPPTSTSPPMKILAIPSASGLAYGNGRIYAFANPIDQHICFTDGPTTGGCALYLAHGPPGDIVADATRFYWFTKGGDLFSQSHTPSNEGSGKVSTSAHRVRERGAYVYVADVAGIRRHRKDTLTPDPDFTLVAGRPIVDFAVDDDGVYWLETDGITSAIGILATSSDAVP